MNRASRLFVITAFITILIFNQGVMPVSAVSNWTLHGKVSNQSGAGVSNVKVLIDDGNWSDYKEAVTDSGGNYTIIGSVSKPYHLQTRTTTTYASSHYWNYQLSSGGNYTVNFTIRPGGGSISGRALNASNNGIPNAYIQIWENTGIGASGSENGAYAETHADANGYFTTNPTIDGGLPTGTMKVRITDGSGMTAWNYSVHVNAGQVTPNINIVVISGNGSITGLISAGTGSILPGAIVVVDNGVGQAGGTSNSNGDYVASGLPAGGYNVVVSKLGYATAHQYNVQVYNAATTNNINFVLTNQIGSISGRVTNTSGIPLSNASIVADTNEGAGFGTAVTDADGYYTLTNLAPMGYYVHAAMSGYAAQSQSTTVQNGVTTQHIDFVLGTSSRTITGRITKDGLAAPFAGIYLNSSNGSSQSLYSHSTTDANGYYTVVDLAPGYYDLHVSGVPGYPNEALFYINVSTANASNVNLNLTVGSSTIAGRVTDYATGNPIAGVSVQPFLTTSPGTYGSVITDANGYYSVSGMWAGNYTFFVNKAGYATLETHWIAVKTSGTTVVNLVLGRPAGVVVRPGNVAVMLKSNDGGYTGMIVELTEGMIPGWSASTSASWLSLGTAGSKLAGGSVGDILIVIFDPTKASPGINTTTITLKGTGLPDGSIPVTLAVVNNISKVYVPFLTK